MGIRQKLNSTCIGVLIPVNDIELKQFDIRESGYNRMLLQHDQIESFNKVIIDENDEDSSISIVDGDEIGHHRKDSNNKNAFTYFDHMKEVISQQRQLQQQQQLQHQPTQNDDDDEEENQRAAEFLPLPQQLPKVWVYIQKNPSKTNYYCPIVQTYVDIILRGCLLISKKFAIEFIQTTKGWCHDEYEDENENENDDLENNMNDDDDGDDDNNNEKGTNNVASASAAAKTTSSTTLMRDTTYWINDRNNPLYVRADYEYSKLHGNKLDSLLKIYRPEIAYRR